MLARMNVELPRLVPQQIFNASICDGALPELDSVDLKFQYWHFMAWKYFDQPHPRHVPEDVSKLVIDIPVQLLSHLFQK